MGGRGPSSQNNPNEDEPEIELEEGSYAAHLVGKLQIYQSQPQLQHQSKIRRGAQPGDVWLRRLRAELASQGITVKKHPKGYKLGGNQKELKEFYPGFDLSKIPNQLDDNALGLEIMRSKGLQRMIVETTKEKPITVLEDLWASWQGGRAKGRYSRVAGFTRYVGSNGYRVTIGDNTLLSELVKGFEALPEQEKYEWVLNSTEPDLLDNLPTALREQVETLLGRPGLLGSSPYLEEARRPLIARINHLIGQNINSLEAFVKLVPHIKQAPSRGALGETFARRFHTGDLTGSERYRKPHFDKDLNGATEDSQPDMLRPLSRCLLDIKVGYRAGDIDDKRLEKYVKLVKATENPANLALNQLLVDLGVAEGILERQDLLFLPDGTGSAETAARNAFALIERKNLTRTVQIYYVTGYNDAGSSKTGVYKLILDEEEDEIIAEFVGDKLPD
jgi:hypothetical protein